MGKVTFGMGKVKLNMQYFVNEEKGVVVCRPTNALQYLSAKLTKIEDTSDTGYVFTEVFQRFRERYEEALDSLIGRADCNFSEGEVFDEEFGRRLAHQRARLQIQNFWSILQKMHHEELIKFVTASFEERIKSNKLTKNIAAEIDRLLDEKRD